MSKAIVLYNSRGGNTKKVALQIAEGLGAECYDNKHIPNLKDYNLVVVGSWVMAGNISFAGKRYLKNLQRKGILGKKLALFITCGSPDDIHPSTEKKVVKRVIKEMAFESMETILKKNAQITILPDRFCAKGAFRMFGKVLDGADHPTEQELVQAKAFGESLRKNL